MSNAITTVDETNVPSTIEMNRGQLENSTQVGSIRKLDIMSMTEIQVKRIKLLAQMLSMSSLGKNKMSEGDYFLVILKGLELGFSPMSSIDNISIIHGIPSVDGKGMLALIYGSGLLKSIDIKSDDKSATVKMERKDVSGVFEYTFTEADAKRLGVFNRNKQYQAQPAVMYKWRAVANCSREAFPDLLGGVYTVEEIAPEAEVTENGTMELPELSSGRNQPELSSSGSQSNTSSKLKTNQATPQIVPKTAGESFLNTKPAKDKLAKWLDENDLRSQAGEFLKLYNVKGFGDIPITDEGKFYADMNVKYKAWATGNDDVEEGEVVEEETPDEKPSSEGEILTTKTDMLTYDGKAIVIDGFTSNGPIKVKSFSRTKFAQMAGKEWAEGWGIPDLEEGQAIEVDMFTVEFEVKHRKNDGARYGVIKSVTVHTPDEESADEPITNPIEEFFGAPEEENLVTS